MVISEGNLNVDPGIAFVRDMSGAEISNLVRPSTPSTIPDQTRPYQAMTSSPT